MGNVRTSVSLPENVFEQAEQLAEEMKVSRSILYSQAIEQYVKVQRARIVVEQMNRVYAEGLTEEEMETLRGFQKLSRKALAREGW